MNTYTQLQEINRRPEPFEHYTADELWTDEHTSASMLGHHLDGSSDVSSRLAREEALFAGTSAGANVVAALRVAGRLGSGKTVVTLLCDSGLKYLSTDLYTDGGDG